MTADTTYRSVVATRLGGPDVLEVVEKPIVEPGPGEVRLHVLAASVSGPDLAARSGRTLYADTPLGHRPPFVPGYSVIGTVDRCGADVDPSCLGATVGVLCVVGGYTEYLIWPADQLIPVPSELDPVDAVPLVLNGIVAYQTLHRKARVRPGETAVIVGAGGGIGTLLLDLGSLTHLELFGVDRAAKLSAVEAKGATAIDYERDDFADVIGRVHPDGVDVIIDSTMDHDTLRRGLGILRRGGRLVTFGDPGRISNLSSVLRLAAVTNLRPDGRHLGLYGTSLYTLGLRRTFLDDWRNLFSLAAAGIVEPVIHRRFGLLEARKAHELLEIGAVVGNVVLVGGRADTAEFATSSGDERPEMERLEGTRPNA